MQVHLCFGQRVAEELLEFVHVGLPLQRLGLQERRIGGKAEWLCRSAVPSAAAIVAASSSAAACRRR